MYLSYMLLDCEEKEVLQVKSTRALLRHDISTKLLSVTIMKVFMLLLICNICATESIYRGFEKR
jgi:hypothetical protein